MTHTRGNEQSIRRALRRDVPATVGIVVDEQDFAAMRAYRSFTFDDHAGYLDHVEGLLRTLRDEVGHTTVALFDPEDFARYCSEAGLDPDTSASRSRYTAEVAAAGATVAYAGQPLDSIVPLLVNRSVRLATWEYARSLLGDLGSSTDCDEDVGRAAFDRASQLLDKLLDAAGPGVHHLVCSVPARDEHLLAVLHAQRTPSAPAVLDSSEGAEFATVLAVGIALESPGGVVLRTSTPDTPDRLHGWRLHHGRLVPLTEAEVFSAYCTDADTGEPLSPEPGVDYCAGLELDD
ncbi:hypothetical protein [Streptomyces sp. NPDC059176]|uniref:hypothetical protein n=1 Tax=unclassified Streptomyces TaxID=2593676 RepID=UPI0036B9FBC5